MATYPCQFDVPFSGNKYLEYYPPHKVYHPGSDLNKGVGNEDEGNEVYCPVAGEVVYTSPQPTILNGQNGGFGWFVILYHPQYNLYSRYAHLKSHLLLIGQKVKEGQVIARVGKTGTEFAHLHFEVFSEDMAEIQRKHFRKWGYYPAGKSKAFVAQYYIDGLKWIDDINARPEYIKEAEAFAGEYLEDVPLLLKGNVHSMILLIKRVSEGKKKEPII